MSEQQPLSQPLQTEEPLLNDQEMQFWLDKAVAWGQADSPDTQKDTCLHMSRLRDFLHQLLTQVNSMSSTTETMKRLPFLGQLLGRLCWNPYITVCDTSRGLLLGCLWGLYSERPSNAVEKKANQWIRKVLCQLSTEEDETAAQALMKCTGVPAKEYHLKVLRKKVALLQENVGQSCTLFNSQRCSCDRIVDISKACIPIVTCPEASSLISLLLQRPVACVTEALSEDFLNALTSAYSRQGLALEEQALVSLWYHSFYSLEEAVLSLLQSVITTGLTPQKLEQQVAQSLLPKACAQHCSIFLVVNDIFRSILKQAEGNESVKTLVQTFTKCFLRELALLKPQTSISVKAFFPQSPSSLLVPLLTMPSEMPQGAWRNHLNWLSSSLQRLTEEEEEGDGRSTRGHHNVFEAWFLLVQCAHWVQVAVQLLVTSGTEDGDPFLWLLIFYHYPTKRWHHRASQLARAKEAWNHIRTLFSGAAHPLPSDRLQSLGTLVSPQPEQQSFAPSLTVSLLVNVAVFCQLPPSGSAEVLQASVQVVDQSGLLDEAACVLSSLELRLNEGCCLSRDTVHLRIKELQKTITQMHSE
ncbi:Fanconi anemia group C protein isoform X1 [Haplochromis burtoni]|uniref:Fanconi anemia group C protein isoform X1 n=1 Tax=Haplochromis burtoni TaxID=8153 RepID=UPI001C2D911A|nr:Fanconi anemia group C protein isoform X1 [Haplochromis burtoni]XP_042075426.1 Fanconi anemia group C protein isoform X1 [Haplochromis burtoni]